MAQKRKADAFCGTAVESIEQQLPAALFGSAARGVDDRELARLRQAFDQLPPATCWEDIRSRLMAALSDLPDEPRPCPPLPGHLPAAAHVGGPPVAARKEAGIGQEECFEPGSLHSASCPALLAAPGPSRKLLWVLSGTVLVSFMLVALYRPTTRSSHSQIVPHLTQGSARSATSSHLPPAQPRLAATTLKGPATITAVQHEFVAASTTVVITLTAPVKYEAHRLTNPERIYVDFHNTRLVPRTNGGNFFVGKPCLRQYRMGSRPGQIARVAFETGTACEFSAKLTGAPSVSLVLLLRPVPPHR